MDNKDNLQFLDNIFTLSELLTFYKEIDNIISNIFKGDVSFEEIINKNLSPEKAISILSFLKGKNVNIKNPIEIQNALLDFKKSSKNIPLVTLELAFEPSFETQKRLSLWFLQRMKKRVLLDIKLKRDIIGGAFISFNGVYKNYTLKTKIEDYFNKSKNNQEENG